MEDIMGHSAHMQRFGSVDSFGQQCTKTRENSSKDVDHVIGTERNDNINSKDAMPLTNNLQIELFDV
jgi:hypothetical protein